MYCGNSVLNAGENLETRIFSIFIINFNFIINKSANKSKKRVKKSLIFTMKIGILRTSW